MVNTMVADDLEMQGTSELAAMVFSLFSQNILASATEV